MDNLKNKTLLVYDQGSFLPLAQRLGKDFGKVLYFTPWKFTWPKFKDTRIGIGVEGVERVDSFFDHLDEADMLLFPNVGDGDLQVQLEACGYKIWGSRKGEELEQDRVATKNLLKKLKLPVGPYEVIKGMDKLRRYLKANENVYVKVDMFRGDMECVDSETEVFTDKGWMLFENLTNEQVLSMDIKTRDTKFVNISNYFKSYYEGEMYQIKTNKIDLVITPNHKLYAGYHKNFKYQSIETLYSKLNSNNSSFNIPIKFNWSGEIKNTYTIVPRDNPTRTEEDKIVNMNLWLEFLE